jgi:hypothetical protein
MNRSHDASWPRRPRRMLVMIGLLCGAWAWLEVADEDVADGNLAFVMQDFDEALLAYERALERSGDDARVFYNIGVALYELARRADVNANAEVSANRHLFQRAGTAFARAARESEERSNLTLAAMAHFGHGNALYRDSRYEDAVHAYQDALRANPKHDDARYNLQIAQAHLDEHRPPGAYDPTPRVPTPGQDPDSGNDANGSSGEAGGASGDGRDATNGRDAQKPSGEIGKGGPSGADADRRPSAAGDPGSSGFGQTSGSEPSADGADGAAVDGKTPPSDSDGARASSPRELDKKLDALERLSRDLRHNKLRRDARGNQRGRVERGW